MRVVDYDPSVAEHEVLCFGIVFFSSIMLLVSAPAAGLARAMTVAMQFAEVVNAESGMLAFCRAAGGGEGSGGASRDSFSFRAAQSWAFPSS
jgi:hypothetical protein